MSRRSALPRTSPGGHLHYPALENLIADGEEEEYRPRLEDDDDEDEDSEEGVTTTAPPTTTTSDPNPSGGAPASLNDIKRLMKEMEERQDKSLDKVLDELQGMVAETFSKLDERLSSLESYTKHHRTLSTAPAMTPRPPRPLLQTQAHVLSASAPAMHKARFLSSALAAHADARNPRPPPPPSTSAPLSSTTVSGPGLGSRHLRGGAAATVDGLNYDPPLDDDDRNGGHVEYREAALKVEDVGAFDGKDVEHYIRTLEIISDIYGERRLLLILPRCMKGVTTEWFISIPADDRHLTRSLAGWSYLLRDGFGEDLRRSKERAASRVFRPWKESVEEYFYDKAAIHKRAEPDITEVELMREVWKGLSPHTSELTVVSWPQYSQKEFRDELIQRQDVIDKSRWQSRFGRGERDLDGGDKRVAITRIPSLSVSCGPGRGMIGVVVPDGG